MKDDAGKQQESPSSRKEHRYVVTLLIYIKLQEKQLSLNNPDNTNPKEQA